MSASVPTLTAFQALEARVAKLEQSSSLSPPTPVTKRIADLIELLGVNTFSQIGPTNTWGAYPADYNATSVIAALNYLTAGVFALRIREYHWAGKEAIQQPWLKQVVAANLGTHVSLAIGANGSAADVPSMLALAADPACGIRWLEGINEPNNDFGSGTISVANTIAAQQALAGATGQRFGPSLVAGMPHPEGWITNYFGAQLASLLPLIDFVNGHYYPPHCPDLTGDGTSLTDYVTGLGTAYGKKPVSITEFHPTLYASAGLDPSLDPYYLLITLFRAAKLGINGLWWYSLFDYGDISADGYASGFFPQSGAINPRPSAIALRNLCSAVADRGANLRTFTPGKLTISVTKAPGVDWDLYQISDGRFVVPIWYSSANLAAPAVSVNIALGVPASSATVVDPLNASGAALAKPTNIPISLQPGVRIVIIQP